MYIFIMIFLLSFINMTYVLVLVPCCLKSPKLLGSLKSPPMPVEGDRCKPESDMSHMPGVVA